LLGNCIKQSSCLVLSYWACFKLCLFNN